MVNVPVIARRELNAYFLSPLAYVVLAGFALVHGLLFVISLSRAQFDPDLRVMQAFWDTLWLLMFAAPVVTMRLISEEVGTGTIQTLLTAPVTHAEVVLGKYLGALIFTMVMVLPLGLEVAFVSSVSPLDFGPVMAGLLGVFLVAGQFLALGVLCSCFTRAQIVSAVLTLVALLALFVLWKLVGDGAPGAARALRYVAPPMHFMSFIRGVVDTRDLVYFAATTVWVLYLSVRVLEYRSRR